jgi:hypothetical protein
VDQSVIEKLLLTVNVAIHWLLVWDIRQQVELILCVGIARGASASIAPNVFEKKISLKANIVLPWLLCWQK